MQLGVILFMIAFLASPSFNLCMNAGQPHHPSASLLEGLVDMLSGESESFCTALLIHVDPCES